MYACESCDLTFADVWRRTDIFKKGKTESSTKTLVKQISISPTMTALLCHTAKDPEPEPNPEELAEGEVTEPVGD